MQAVESLQLHMHTCMVVGCMSERYLLAVYQFTMDCISVQCTGNNSKQYNGNVWLKRLQDIVKVNGKKISNPLFPSNRSMLYKFDRMQRETCKAVKLQLLKPPCREQLLFTQVPFKEKVSL